MKNIISILSMITVVLWLGPAQAQELSVANDTLVWEVTQLTDTVNNVTVDYTCTFETYRTDKIVWTQQNNYITEFLPVSFSSTWTNTGMDGTAVYQGTYLDKPCTVTFSRSNNATKIRINLSDNGVSVFPHVFHVNAITIKQ